METIIQKPTKLQTNRTTGDLPSTQWPLANNHACCRATVEICRAVVEVLLLTELMEDYKAKLELALVDG